MCLAWQEHTKGREDIGQGQGSRQWALCALGSWGFTLVPLEGPE